MKLLKNKLLILSLLSLFGAVVIFAVAPKAQAKAFNKNSINTIAAINCSKSQFGFFGLVPWYQYLNVTPDTSLGVTDNCAVSFNLAGNGGQVSNLSDIWLIALAVFEDLLRIAGLAAVGFVIYGGFRYVTSQGEPENTKAALATITNALIGLAIAVLAATTVALLAGKLGGT